MSSLTASSTPPPASDAAASVQGATVDVAAYPQAVQTPDLPGPPLAELTLLVKNIPEQSNYRDILKLFHSKLQYYPLVKLRMPQPMYSNRDQDKKTSMAWVKVRNQDDADLCLRDLHHARLPQHTGHLGLRLQMARREMRLGDTTLPAEDLLI